MLRGKILWKEKVRRKRKINDRSNGARDPSAMAIGRQELKTAVLGFKRRCGCCLRHAESEPQVCRPLTLCISRCHPSANQRRLDWGS